MNPVDLIVIGGGVIGASCARELAKRGVAVELLDAGLLPGTASVAAAGMLAPMAETDPEDELLGFGVLARDRYTELAPELLEETGVDIQLQTDGILQVAFDEADVQQVRAQLAWQRQSGFNTAWLDPQELKERAPGISDEALGALLAPEDGSLDPELLRTALLKSAIKHGARVSNIRADSLLIAQGAVTAVETSHGKRTAGAVLVAAGAWSKNLEGLPRPLSVEPIRGQMASLDWPEDEPSAVVYGPAGYVLERSGEAVAGSTMENAGFDASTTEAGIEAILANARRTYPALASASPTRAWAGLRPGTPDGKPILGPDPEVPNLWYATGHGRNGILLAGISGQLIASRFTGEPVELDLCPLDPGRFWSD